MVDPLSDILSLLKPRRQGSGVVDLGGDWQMQCPAFRGVRCYAISRGECWIMVEGLDAPVHLTRDDCLLLATGRPFRMASAAEPSGRSTSAPSMFSHDRILTVNGGGACVLIGAHFHLDDVYERLFSSALAPLVVVRDPGQREALGSALKGLWRELETPQPGGRLVVDHLNQMMLIFALRLYVNSQVQRPTGWLAALSDKRMVKAFAAMHASPEQSWTLQALARQAGMSRTLFAECFKALVGTTPMAYLNQWRMAVAADHIRTSHMPVGQVALAVGYGSGPAFSTAFRKAFGVSPSEYAMHDAELAGMEKTSYDSSETGIPLTAVGEKPKRFLKRTEKREADS
ncbi:AraC family transcriptional regulator [Dyella sp.]|uniref:AraC family transcriptional regulator n=1 Tax=Dyella sp. TaxID=1869338 RepID=UPI002ED57EFE